MRRKRLARAILSPLPVCEGIQIGESITDLLNPSPLEPLLIDEPTLAMIFTVNSGPLSGKEGSYLTSRDPARPPSERIANQLRFDSRGKIRTRPNHCAFSRITRCCHGELQAIAILIETLCGVKASS